MQLYSEGPNPETLLLEEFLSNKQIHRSHIAVSAIVHAIPIIMSIRYV